VIRPFANGKEITNWTASSIPFRVTEAGNTSRFVDGVGAATTGTVGVAANKRITKEKVLFIAKIPSMVGGEGGIRKVG
jgi:hypothetical protein